jgi:hypothetical protein
MSPSSQAFLAEYLPPAQAVVGIETMAQLGVLAVFRAHSAATQPTILASLERRERVILILLDGKRNIQEVARLSNRSELEVAQILVRLLKRSYVEFIAADKSP